MTKKNFTPLHLIIGMTVALSVNFQTVYGQETWEKRGTEPDKYTMGIDKSVQHNKQNAMTVKSIDNEVQGFGTYVLRFKPDQYISKRIRMTSYMMSKDVKDWAGFWLRVDDRTDSLRKTLAFDNMQDRAVKGTTDWNKYEIVLDVPNNAANISFGGLLSKTGQIWFTDPVFDIVDNSVPTTCDCKPDTQTATNMTYSVRPVAKEGDTMRVIVVSVKSRETRAFRKIFPRNFVARSQKFNGAGSTHFSTNKSTFSCRT